MKRMQFGVAAVVLLFASAVSLLAVEGLKVTRQGTNVVLSWSSVPPETYVVQYRSALGPASPWQTLVPSVAAAASTNKTSFVHTNGASGNSTGFYRVVANDVHLYGITNGATVSGTLNVPIEYSVNTTDLVSGFSFSINSLPIAGTIPQSNGISSSLQWDTTAMPNGTYALTPEIDFSTADPVQGTPITITVSNLVSYPNYFTSVFGDWMWIYAEVAVYPANYQLDMYDSNTNYIGTFADYTPDGVISFTWDLTDGNGYTFPDTTFIGQFTITPTNAQMALHQTKSQARGAKPLAGSSTTVPARRWGKEGSWSGIGNFVVAYSAVDNDSTKTYKVGLMVLGGTDSSDGGAVGSLGFQGLGPYQLSPGNVYGSSAFYMGDSVTRTQLLSYLGDLGYRNFYFFGHGSANSFGGGTSLIPTITANDLQPVLRNLIVGNMGANYHPYRFVFIDGCSTGKGTMCEKFGVPSGTLNNAFFGTAGVRSRAYLGFTGSVPFDPSQWDWRSIMLGYFFGDWVSRKPLWVCVSNAVNGTYQTFQKMPSSAVIYGANDLQINSP